MTLPSDGFPLAAAVSPRLQVVATTGSTNADLVAAVERDPAGHPHLSVLLTDDQRAGRGRLGRTWTAPPGTALAVSTVVDTRALPVRARGWIPLIAGSAMADAIAEPLRGTPHAVSVKWPNDVLVDGRKISGILAEVVPSDTGVVVVGAGVNTRMIAADLPVAGATSFGEMGRPVDEDRLVADYLRALGAQVAALAAAGGDAIASGVHAGVQKQCATVGSEVTVALPDGTSLVGSAERLDPDGHLVVVASGVETVVAAGDVVHVRAAAR